MTRGSLGLGQRCGPVGWAAVLLMAQLPLLSRLREAWGEAQAHCLQPLPAPRATSPAMLGRIVCPGTWNVQPRTLGTCGDQALNSSLSCASAGEEFREP